MPGELCDLTGESQAGAAGVLRMSRLLVLRPGLGAPRRVREGDAGDAAGGGVGVEGSKTVFEGDLSNQNGLFPGWNGHDLLSNLY